MSPLERFLKYITFDTQADETNDDFPSTKKQLLLGKELLKELHELQIDSHMDIFGQVYAFLPGDPKQETIGFNAHIDTATELSGACVKVQIITNYDGGSIKLGKNYEMSPIDFPVLKKFIGGDLVTTDGNTLLGADDKAGIAIIMSLLAYLKENPHIKHHAISVLFSLDEEIGEGATHFNHEMFKADYAFTIDGSEPTIVAKENFNAAHVNIELNGVSIHPGEAKGKMINASTAAIEFISLLPKNEVPELTEKREGFHHLTTINGSVDRAKLTFIVRNHDFEILKRQVDDFYEATKKMNAKYNKTIVTCAHGYDYKNMISIFEKDDRAIQKIEETFSKMQWKIQYEAIRGGTDGATFSFKGCPTPNLGTGSYNHHGRYEFLSIQEFHQMIELLKTLVTL